MKIRHEWNKVRDKVRSCIGLGSGLGLLLGSGLIFSVSSQTVYLIYRFLVEGAEQKSHLEKNVQ